MAFSIRSLSVLAYANGFTLWHYKTGIDPVDVVTGPGFFGEGADMLATGDVMIVSGLDGARVLCVGLGGHNGSVLTPLR